MVGAGGVARTQFDGVAGQLHPVGGGRRGEGLQAEGGDGGAQRRIGGRCRRPVQQVAGHQSAGTDGLQLIADFHGGIQFVRPDVHDEAAAVGNDIVRQAGFDLRDIQADWPHLRRDPRETVAAQPGDVVEGQIQGVDPVAAGGVAALADGFPVEHQQAAFTGGGPHPGRFTDDGPVGAREPVGRPGRLAERSVRSVQPAQAVGTGGFLFADQQQEQVERQRPSGEMPQDGQHGHEAAAVVVRAQPPDDGRIGAGIIGTAGVAGGRRHGVHVGDQRQGFPARIGRRSCRGDVSARAAVRESLRRQPSADLPANLVLLPRRGRDADQVP